MLVVTGIDDYYPFLAFSDLTYHLEDDDTRICFLVELSCLIIRTLNLEVATKRLLH